METSVNSPTPLKAIIIGAGASGLQIASLLQEKGFEVIILEAMNRIGGRILEDRTFADFPIELGAEEVHGETSHHYKIAKQAGAEVIDESELSYFVEYEGELYNDEELIEENKAFGRILDLDWEEICSYDDKKEDISLINYIRENGFPEDLYHTIDGIFAAEWGTDLENLSVKGIKKWDVDWDSGHKNFLIKNMSNYEIITKAFSNVLDKVVINTPVSQINYSLPKGVEVKDKSGNIFKGDLVVVSVPISQLKQNKIQFIPDLPERKKIELEKVHMDPAMKVFFKFKRQFWDDSLGIVITKGNVRLMWPSSTGGKTKKNCHCLTGLITGKTAAKLSELDRDELKKVLLEDLKRVYGESIEGDLEDFMVKDWTKEEYIEGGYTYPHIKEDENTRHILRESIMDRVYFVGEGMSTKFSLISGAMESSFIAANEICSKYLDLKVNERS